LLKGASYSDLAEKKKMKKHKGRKKKRNEREMCLTKGRFCTFFRIKMLCCGNVGGGEGSAIE